jgi:hypothetical protein
MGLCNSHNVRVTVTNRHSFSLEREIPRAAPSVTRDILTLFKVRNKLDICLANRLLLQSACRAGRQLPSNPHPSLYVCMYVCIIYVCRYVCIIYVLYMYVGMYVLYMYVYMYYICMYYICM